jgi:hypothetical protein
MWIRDMLDVVFGKHYKLKVIVTLAMVIIPLTLTLIVEIKWLIEKIVSYL